MISFVDGTDPVSKSDPDRDLPSNVRLVYTRFGDKVRLERRDPHHLVYVVWYKGPAPDPLSGSYTSFERAREDVERYLNNETINTVVETPVEKPEPIKYKNTKAA